MAMTIHIWFVPTYKSSKTKVGLVLQLSNTSCSSVRFKKSVSSPGLSSTHSTHLLTHLITVTCFHSPDFTHLQSCSQYIYPSSSLLQYQIVPYLLGRSSILFSLKPYNQPCLFLTRLSVCLCLDYLPEWFKYHVWNLVFDSTCFWSPFCPIVCLIWLLICLSPSRKDTMAFCPQLSYDSLPKKESHCIHAWLHPPMFNTASAFQASRTELSKIIFFPE